MKTKQLTRLTIPMDKELRANLKKRAESLGFDSTQALLRYVSKALIDERQVVFGDEQADDWGEPSPRALQRLKRLSREARKLSAEGKLKGYTSARALVKDLMDEAD